ncbi:MAG: 5-formyltetrahydrofolate cyclo-ligase [Desulfurococcales archaeon]|nr:5-formyltetrahydrofolate cyclo-ligase [Desulfurococcales archaeon]
MATVRSKDEIRRMVWDRLASAGVARPPLPPHGRIPNFQGSWEAARRITSLPGWRRARLVKVNPDSPQRPVRLAALREGKLLLMPTPRLRSGFLLLDPSLIPGSHYTRASTIRGAFRYGKLLGRLGDLQSLPGVDFIVEGSVAVNRWGERLGKGEGYAELEYAILRELGLVGEEVPIATSVHDLQVLPDRLPQDPYDVPVDYIATPTRLIEAVERPPRPPGILWDKLSREKLEEIPLLRELAGRR